MSLVNSRRFRLLVENEFLDKTYRERIDLNLQRNNWIELPDDDRNFDPGSILKERYLVESAGNHLYEIGLSLFKLGEKNRLFLHNPYLSLIVFSLITIQQIMSIVLPSDCAK